LRLPRFSCSSINVAGLVGARARDRESELSIRGALGANRRELAAVVLGETVLIALIGAVVGIAIATPLVASVVAMLPQWLTLLKAPRIDERVIGFATLAAVLPVIACALVPVASTIRRIGRHRTATTIHEASRTQWSQRFLLAAESAIGIVLVVAGTLVLAGFALLRADDSGFGRSSLAVIELVPTEELSPAAREAAGIRVLERLQQIPGVRAAATIDVPLLEQSYAGSPFAPPRGAKRIFASEVHVSADFFDVTGLRALDGRLLSNDELGLPRPLAVVSENLARAYWPNQRAIGQTLESSLEGAPPAVTVVGVVKDLRFGSQKDQAHGEIYLPSGLGGHLLKVYLLKTTTPDDTARRAALAIRADLKGFIARRAESMETALSKSVREERLQAVLFGGAGGASLLLLAVGVGGLAAMGTARRVREIGIRSALGARRHQLVGMIVLEHLRPALAGMTIGLIASWWTTRVVRVYLYEIDVHEPSVWLAATMILVLVATIGGWLPARRAARVDPMVVLRAE
jgi:predicted permease